MGRLRYLVRLAWLDLRDEWPVSVAICLAIVAVAAPLLVLLGLREGVIGEMFQRLRSNPSMRIITLDATGSARFDEAWFAAARSWPETGFVLPSTRFAAGQADFTGPDDKGVEERARPDPDSFRRSRVRPGHAATAGAVRGQAQRRARRAGVGAGTGDTVAAAIERRVEGGRLEPLMIKLRIVDVAPAQGYEGRAAFVGPTLLTALEDFRDGFAAPLLGVTVPTTSEGRAPPIPTSGSTRTILRTWRRWRPGCATRTASASARAALRSRPRQSRRQSECGDAGPRPPGRARARRRAGGDPVQHGRAQARTIAVLGLMGFGRFWLVGLPVAEAALLGAAGAVLTIAMAFLFGAWINAHLAASFDASGQACVLPPALLAAGTALPARPVRAAGAVDRRPLCDPGTGQ